MNLSDEINNLKQQALKNRKANQKTISILKS